MKINYVKYYIIMALLLAMIVCVVAFTGYETTNSVLEPIIPEEPSVEAPESPDNTDESVVDTMPTFKAWDKLWDYSYNILLNGYIANFNMSVNANSMGVTAIQSFKGSEKYSSKESSYKLEYFTTNSNSMAGSDATYYEYSLYKNGINEKRRTFNINYNEGTYTFTDEPITKEEANFENFSALFALRGLEFKKENVDLILFDKISNSSYYIIKLGYKLDKLTDAYYNGFTSTGLVDSVEINSITLEIRINKKNGHLYSITTTEDYKNHLSFLPMTADCVSTAIEVFSMNENVLV